MKPFCALFLFLAISSARAADEETFVPLFNGRDLTGWVNANCAPETWSVRDGMIHCTGRPTGALRTTRQYENFILEAEWRHLTSGGNSGVFIWGTPIAAPGVPFLRGIEVREHCSRGPTPGPRSRACPSSAGSRSRCWTTATMFPAKTNGTRP